eukprot:4576100-Amphidinium_carterae.1
MRSTRKPKLLDLRVAAANLIMGFPTVFTSSSYGRFLPGVSHAQCVSGGLTYTSQAFDKKAPSQKAMPSIRHSLFEEGAVALQHCHPHLQSTPTL